MLQQTFIRFCCRFNVILCRRILELKEISCILALWIWKKAFDWVLREVIRWAMCKLGVEEWVVLAVLSMYTGAKELSGQFMVTINVLR